MSNTIKITQCDNELILFAIRQDGTECYEICNIKSGNSNSVDVTINLEEGNDVSAPITATGIAIGSEPINITSPFVLPQGEYRLVYAGLNWGGPYNFQFSLNTGQNTENFKLENDPNKELYGVIWSRGDDGIHFNIQ